MVALESAAKSEHFSFGLVFGHFLPLKYNAFNTLSSIFSPEWGAALREWIFLTSPL